MSGNGLIKMWELLLGARSGLRGYDDRTFSGDHRLLFNIEDRFHIKEDIFKLISLGGVFFFDMGGVSRTGFGDIITDELYADVGFGLRFGMTRSSGGNVVRLDLAFALRDGPDGTEQWDPRILITSGQLFNAFLSTETTPQNATRVSTGFLP